MKRILVIRNDKLGDFMLAYPSFAMLKTNLPDVHIAALVPRYTQEMAQCCPWIDEVVIDPISIDNDASAWTLARQLKKQRYDAVVALFSSTRIGLAARLAGIPLRVAPATKLAQIFFNRTLRQRRSESVKPEHQYNCDLIAHFLTVSGHAAKPRDARPYLQFDRNTVRQQHQDFCSKHRISLSDQLVFIHAGSGGSARNLHLAQYAALARALKSDSPITLVFSAGPTEIASANELAQNLRNGPHHAVVYPSQHGLQAFAQHIQFASAFIGGSTGPLHIAGALDVPTAGFYPRSRVNSALRWQTLNSPERRLAFSPTEQAEEDDMSRVDIESAAKLISQRFLSGNGAPGPSP